MKTVFLSYGRHDRSVVEEIAAAFEAQGVAVWFDRSLEVGDAYRLLLDEKVDEAALIVVLWSPHSIRSRWVISEAMRARDAGKLVSVAMGDVLPPIGFRQHQFFAVSEHDGAERWAALAQLVAPALVEPATPPQPRQAAGFFQLDFAAHYRLGFWRALIWSLLLAGLSVALFVAAFGASIPSTSWYALFGAFMALPILIGRLIYPDFEGLARRRREPFFVRGLVVAWAVVALALIAAAVMFTTVTYGWANTPGILRSMGVSLAFLTALITLGATPLIALAARGVHMFRRGPAEIVRAP